MTISRSVFFQMCRIYLLRLQLFIFLFILQINLCYSQTTESESTVNLVPADQLSSLITESSDTDRTDLLKTLDSMQREFEEIVSSIDSINGEFKLIKREAKQANLKAQKAWEMEAQCREERSSVFAARKKLGDKILSDFIKKELHKMKESADKCFRDQKVVLVIMLKQLGEANSNLSDLEEWELILPEKKHQVASLADRIRQTQSVLDLTDIEELLPSGLDFLRKGPEGQ